jgi:fructose-specific phosphotransferase system IIC component
VYRALLCLWYQSFEVKDTLAAALMQIGGGSALMVPVLAGFIAFSIADRPGLTPGLIGGCWPSAAVPALSAGLSPVSLPVTLLN